MKEELEQIIESFNEYKRQTKILSDQLDEALKVIATKDVALDNLFTVIKNIHICVGAGDQEKLDECMREVAKFILSNEAIKSGVRTNAGLN